MEATEQTSMNSIENLALKLLTELENGADHPETWHKIASFAASNRHDILKPLTSYLTQLASIPQNALVTQLILTLKTVCIFYLGDEITANNKFYQLLMNYPQSLLVKGAYLYTQNNKPSSSNEVPNQLLKTLYDFIAVQSQTNQTLLSKLQKIEVSIERSKAQNLQILHKELHDIHQTLQMVARKTSTGKKQKIRCVFIISFYQAWNTLADIYDVMRDSEDFDPIVVSTARKRAKDTHVIFGEELTHEFLKSENIPHIRLNTAIPDNHCMDILKALEPDIIFRQSAWHDLPPVFNAEDINFARLCYVPYSFTAVKRLDKDEPVDTLASTRHTNLYYHQLCWRIFCETEMHKNMYIDTSTRAGQNVVVTGYPKFDRLIAAKKQAPYWPIKNNTAKRRFRIIWAPHHSVTREVMGFGTFVEVHKEILQWAKECEQEYEFVMKPHPALVGELVHALRIFTQEYMDSFFEAWNALPNTAVFEGGDYGPLFMGSNVMLTDGVGFLSEYQLFEKPLVFLDSGHHFGFNAAGEVMMESANSFRSLADARRFIETLKNGQPDPMREKQQSVLTRIMPYPGQSAQKIVQSIRDGLSSEGVI